MSVEAGDGLDAVLASLDISDGPGIRTFAQRVEALDDRARAAELCERSRALRAAVGRLRADALSALLVHDERDEFIRRTADAEFMAYVELDELRVPRFLAVDSHACVCGIVLMLPYPKQGGPGFAFDCPACDAPYLARLAYAGTQYRVEVESDLRPARKRKKKGGVL